MPVTGIKITRVLEQRLSTGCPLGSPGELERVLMLGSTTGDPELIRLRYDLSRGLSKALLGILACIAALEELVSNYKLGNHLGVQL